MSSDRGSDRQLSSLSMFLCGDVMLGRGVDQILAQPCEPTLHESYMDDARDYVALAEQESGEIPWGAPPAYPWGDAIQILDEVRPDARIVNLETSITRSPDYDRDKGINYRVSPENATSLAAAHVDVCALGNNHVLDWGERGLFDTLDTLDRLHIKRCGAGRDLDEATRPAVIDLDDRRIAVFSIGVLDAGVPPWWAAGPDRPGVNFIRVLDDAALAAVRRAIEPWQDDRTLVVVSLHWGGNWGYGVPDAHRRFAHQLVDAGVHVVHGHSSHHVKGIEVRSGQLILYGCGDLITDYEGIHGHEQFRGDLGLLYIPTFDRARKLGRLVMFPTRMQRLQLRRADAKAIAWLEATLTRCGKELGTSAAVENDHLRLVW
ncbi:MAG: CapA family protein [Kofleriaceae bacterium]|nr:CapA family protein [Kofleriaceae bacterium]